MEEKKSTREKILEKSIEMFNQQGVTAVSTNHVCEALDISPGNLYYYFRSRENIVYSIAIEYARELSPIWVFEKGQAISAAGIVDTFRHTLDLNQKYRFLLREAQVLVDSGLNLRKLMEKPIAEQREALQRILHALTRAGYFRLSRETLEWLSGQIQLILFTPDLPPFIAGESNEVWQNLSQLLLIFATDKGKKQLEGALQDSIDIP